MAQVSHWGFFVRVRYPCPVCGLSHTWYQICETAIDDFSFCTLSHHEDTTYGTGPLNGTLMNPVWDTWYFYMGNLIFSTEWDNINFLVLYCFIHSRLWWEFLFNMGWLVTLKVPTLNGTPPKKNSIQHTELIQRLHHTFGIVWVGKESKIKVI